MRHLLWACLLLGRPAYAQCLNSVADALTKLAQTPPQKILIRTNGVIDQEKYTSRLVNRFGLNNHFQGVVLDGETIFISGGNYYEKKGQVFVGAKQGEEFVLQKEVVPPGAPHFWHAGALGLIDQFLLVPNEDFKEDKSLLIAMDKSGHRPLFSLGRVERDAGAVSAITHNDVKLMAVATPEQVDFYHIEGESFRLMGESPGNFFNGSSVALLKQCDGKLYYLDMHNTGYLGPWLSWSDVVDLYEVTQVESKRPVLTKVQRIEFKCQRDCNFSAGANATVADGQLSIYSVRHFHEDGVIEFNQFKATAEVAQGL